MASRRFQIGARSRRRPVDDQGLQLGAEMTVIAVEGAKGEEDKPRHSSCIRACVLPATALVGGFQ
jgi:hypothetical protein